MALIILSTTTMSETTKTALDEIKAIEAQARKIALIDVIAELKSKAREVKKLKFQTEVTLKEMGYDEKEVKSIIDYLNNQVDIDEEEIVVSIKRDLGNRKDKAMRKMKEGNTTTFTSSNFTPMNTLTNWSLQDASHTFASNAVSAVNCVSTASAGTTTQLSSDDMKFID